MDSIVLVAIIWVGISYYIGTLGREKAVGFNIPFIISLLLTPIIGLLVVIASNKPTPKKPSVMEDRLMDLQRLQNLRECGALTEEEFKAEKERYYRNKEGCSQPLHRMVNYSLRLDDYYGRWRSMANLHDHRKENETGDH